MRRTSWFVFLSSLLTLLTTSWGSGRADVSPNKVQDIWAIEGEDVELPCDLRPNHEDDTVSMVLWYKDVDGVPFYQLDARNGNLSKTEHWAIMRDFEDRTYLRVDDLDGIARLRIVNVTYKDQGLFRCRVDFHNSSTNNYLVNLTLIESPSKPVIYDAQGREVRGMAGPFLEGYDLHLTCQVYGGKPRPTVTWWQGNTMLDDVVDTPTIIGSANKFTVNRLFISKVTGSLQGAKLECRAESKADNKSRLVKTKVPLNIYLKPAGVHIILAENQIYAGRPMTAHCETWGSSPLARLVWRLGGRDISRESNSPKTNHHINLSTSELALVLDKDDDTKELTCRAENPRFPGGVVETTKVLRVLYPPIATLELANGYNVDTLREGDDVKFVCNYQSNPEPMSIEWLHNNKRLEHNVEAGILLAYSSLTLRVLTLANDGAYACIVRNSVGEVCSPTLDIRMKYAPRCKSGYEWQDVVAVPDTALRLRCEIEADPKDGVRFSWTRNSSLGNVVAVSNPRPLVASIEYVPKTEEDYGTLACWASNSVGRQKRPCMFNVLLAKPPQKPLDCNIRNETSALEVNCVPGSNGGLPQQFVLEVHGTLENSGLLNQIPQSDQGVGEATVSAAAAVYQDRSDRPSFQLNGLQPGYDYTVAVYAENSRGRSQPVLIENIRVAEPVQKKPPETRFLSDLSAVIPHATSVQNALIVVGLIIVVSLVLVGIGVTIGLMICRRRLSPSPIQESLDDFTIPTYISAQRIEPRSRYGNSRPQSQRTSLYIEESRNGPDLLQQVDINLQ